MNNPSLTSRRQFLTLLGGAAAGSLATYGYLHWFALDTSWHYLLPYYHFATRSNIVVVNGRRALLSAKIYPGTYVRDAIFWGPLGLDDPQLGYECYQWFAESPLETGQIRSAVPLTPEEVALLTPQDDEGTLLFIIASNWLAQQGFAIDRETVEHAYTWVQTHVVDDFYVSPPGPFRYWADTVAPDRDEVISHNQGLLCLARRAMQQMGFGGVTEAAVTAVQTQYRALYNSQENYLPLGKYSNFAAAQDTSALFPEFLSRYLHQEPILSDEMVANTVQRLTHTALVHDYTGQLAGIKVICDADGEFLPPEWYHVPEINTPGEYQNGGYWPLYGLVALALGYAVSGKRPYARMIGQLITYELATDPRSKEIMRMADGQVGVFDPGRTNYTWNALIPTACRWCGLTA
ncbi:MAG: hypothetical protein KC415_22740 [Anaerolineales bacterium]|nr:hypothetical protein [Anaerolineales bacterium]